MNRGSEWDFASEKDIILIAFFNLFIRKIDPTQKWLPLNYSFVHIQNSLPNLVRDNKFFTIFASKTRLVRLFKYEQKNNIKAAIFA